MKKICSYILGIILLLFGIYLSVFEKEPHFYTLFSLGLLIIFINIYNSISKRKLFEKNEEILKFSLFLLISCIVVDQIGLYLGYWAYQYKSFLDNLIKYIFEWAVPLTYFMLALMISKKIFQKGFDEKTSFVLSLIIPITLLGLFTEYINIFSNSWIVLKMPITNYKIGNFFLMFQTNFMRLKRAKNVPPMR